MELINGTQMRAGYNVSLDAAGREWLVVVVKGTFELVQAEGRLYLAEEQIPLALADTFLAGPGLSAPAYEADFALRKKRCDLIVHASAYAPGGRPVTVVTVGFAVGQFNKSFEVVGDRVWQAGISGVAASAPRAFDVMPLSYGRAFGGVDDRHEDESKHATYTRNPVGRGFHRHLRREWIDQSPLPNTQELGRPIERPDGNYRPMAMGPIGRNWEPRFRLAGTYDQQWLDDRFPFLPLDFDDLYNQSAPEDQQIDFPFGGEQVVLLNLTPDGRSAFQLPKFDAQAHFIQRRRSPDSQALMLDTILINPSEGSVVLTWRTSRLLERDIFDIERVVIGRLPRPRVVRDVDTALLASQSAVPASNDVASD